MKKFLSLSLATFTLAASLAACAPAADGLDPAITLTSSDAQTYAEWLDERLENIPDDVVIGVGSNEAYGIDMTDFDEDGYIAREINGEVLLFGKTAAGLDRAVREYAKAADNGTTADLDTVYHEGPRIKKLTIADTDISEFTIVYNDDRPIKNPDLYTMTQGNAQFAAKELARLIKVATGITLDIQPKEVSGPMIKIDYLEDDSLGTNGFTYKVEDGNLYINGAMKAHGCANGVYYFLETECGWDRLTSGDSELQPADHVDVPEGTAAEVDPIFDFFFQIQAYSGTGLKNERSAEVKNYQGYIKAANHGLQANVHDWSGTGPMINQICYTDEIIYSFIIDQIYFHLQSRTDSGEDIGVDITSVDIAQPDAFGYCKCTECWAIYKEENEAHAGAVVRFANNVAADMEAEGFGGLAYLIFAYHGSNKPCVTVPRPDVYVTFCTDGACMMHPLDGSECNGVSHDMTIFDVGIGACNNSDYAEWIKGWDALTEDNLYVYHYFLDANFGQYTAFDMLYDDFMFFKENGINGFYLCGRSYGLGLARLRASVFGLLQYHPNMTEEEYTAELDNIMRSEYGDGYAYVEKYISVWRSIENTDKCLGCWYYDNKLALELYDVHEYSRRADEMFDLLSKARSLANTADQEDRIDKLRLEVAYRQCVTTYFKAYDAQDTETIEFLKGRYQCFLDLLTKCGYQNDTIVLGFSSVWEIGATLEEEMWTQLLDYRDELTPEGTTQREMPAEYATE